MYKFNDLLREIKNVPDERLAEVYEFIHALSPAKKQNSNRRKKLLSFAGAFSDMNKKDYDAFLAGISKTR